MSSLRTNLQPDELTAASRILRTRLEQLKNKNPQDFEWYPYDSLAGVAHLERLSSAVQTSLIDLARRDGVLDIGCGDGELSFLFEALGCRVHTIDHPVTNHNRMQGVRALKRLLGSSVGIIETDLDEQLALPLEPRGLALFLGILYHLKNPFHALERLAKHSAWCFLSTRVARCFPDGSPMPGGQPIAYLVDSNELNQDETNYWIFSRAGLDRLLQRTSWEVVDSFSVGDTEQSNPVDPGHDERVFCLLKSHYGLANVELVEGWHDVEDAGWRWTRQRFSLRARLDSGRPPERIRLRIFLPPEVYARLGSVTLSAAVEGQPLRPLKLEGPGEYTFAANFHCSAAPLFTFDLDKGISASPDDPRELGIIVASVDLD